MDLPHIDPLDSVRIVVSDFMPSNAAPFPLPNGSLLVSRAFYEKLLSEIPSAPTPPGKR